MIVGIDLGTTHSLIGVMEKGRTKLFVDTNGSPLIPSVIRVKENDTVEVGYLAKEAKGTDPLHVAYSVKRFMGRGIEDAKHWISALPFDFSESDAQGIRLKLGKHAYSSVELSSMILRKLKSLAESQGALGVHKAVITVPAYFDETQRQATKRAGELAGLEVVRILNEPTAACLAYGLDKKAKGTVAIFDLGGGTFDISILQVRDGIFEVLATNGDTALGGDDFDHAIVEHFLPAVQTRWKTITPELKARLIAEAEKVKRSLTESESASFVVESEGHTFNATFTRAQFEAVGLPILERTRPIVEQCLKDAGVKVDQLNDAILVGGATRIPMVKQFVETLFARVPLCSINPEEVVAMGATVQANVLSGQSGETLLLDVVPLSLGIETVGGVVSKIIQRNTPVPVSSSEHFSTFVDGQTSIDLHVLQGERELVKDNRSLARFKLSGLPPMPAGIPKLEVEFTIDVNGILSVRAVERRTGKTAQVTVQPSYGLTDSLVEQQLQSAFDNAESDFSARFLAEARTEADSLIRATRKSMEKGTALLTPEERSDILRKLEGLSKSLQSDDFKHIRTQIETLNHSTQPLAEKLLNNAVNEALKGRDLRKEQSS